jgi:hypothetical protein
MKPPRRFSRLLVAVLLLAQGACLTPPRPESALYLRSESPKRIWVSLANGEEMVIDGPKVYGDSLLGFTQKGETKEEVWLPLSDLTEVRTRHVSGPRTALLGGLIAAGVIAGVVMIPAAAGERDKSCMNEGEPCESA